MIDSLYDNALIDKCGFRCVDIMEKYRGGE